MRQQLAANVELLDRLPDLLLQGLRLGCLVLLAKEPGKMVVLVLVDKSPRDNLLDLL